MKIKFIKLSLVIIAATSFNACEGELDKYAPYDQDTFENFYKNPADFEQAKNAMYSAFRGSGYYDGGGSGGGFISTPDIMSDNLIFNTEGRQSGRVNAEFTYNTNNTPSGLYGTAYRIISRANSIIDKIDNLSDGAFKNNILGQALAVRAICHFDVARAYAEIPTQSPGSKQTIGIAYVKTFNPQQLPSRLATVEAVYNEIINDLETASTLIALDNSVGGSEIFLDQVSVKALLSRVYLYNGNYELAATRAQEALDLGAQAKLATRAQFPGIWNDSIEADCLFKIAITTQDAVQIGVDYFQFLSGSFFSEYVCDYDFYNLYQGSDIRKTSYFTVGVTNDREYIHVTKYYRDLANSRFLDGKYMRASEVCLNLAEAKARIGGNDLEARAALDMIRSRRHSVPVPGTGGETGTALLNAILLERRLELAFESDRFFTLKRLGLSLQRSGKGHLSDGTGNIAVPQTLPAGDHRWQWPIDQTTLNINPNMTPTPGYGS